MGKKVKKLASAFREPGEPESAPSSIGYFVNRYGTQGLSILVKEFIKRAPSFRGDDVMVLQIKQMLAELERALEGHWRDNAPEGLYEGGSPPEGKITISANLFPKLEKFLSAVFHSDSELPLVSRDSYRQMWEHANELLSELHEINAGIKGGQKDITLL